MLAPGPGVGVSGDQSRTRPRPTQLPTKDSLIYTHVNGLSPDESASPVPHEHCDLGVLLMARGIHLNHNRDN